MFITYVVEDLKICTRPTCRSILGDGIREKSPNRKSFFLEFTNCIYIPPPPKAVFRSLSHRVGIFFLRIPSPRIPQQLQVGRVQLWRSCDFLSEISSRGAFLCIYIFSKKSCILKFVISFLRGPSPRIPQQVGRVQIWRSCDFFKARYPAAGHKCKSTH